MAAKKKDATSAAKKKAAPSPSAQRKAYKAAVAELKQAFRDFQASQLDFFVKLGAYEKTGEWRYGGHLTFKEFLVAEFPKSEVARPYGYVMRAINAYGLDFVRAAGVSACFIIAKRAILIEHRNVEAMRIRIDRFIKVNGVPPDEQVLRSYAKEVAPVLIREAGITTKDVLIESLQRQLREAKAEIAKLTKERDALSARLAKQYQRQSGKKGKGAAHASPS